MSEIEIDDRSSTESKIITKAVPIRYPTNIPMMAILNDRKLNFLNIRSKPTRNTVKRTPIPMPINAFTEAEPSGRDTIYVVIKKILKIAKNIRIKVIDLDIFSSGGISLFI